MLKSENIPDPWPVVLQMLELWITLLPDQIPQHARQREVMC